ncbi:unnamed protein product [Paramecium octaurelia]|uniref:Uncharacterized protein n=1 Tax=Paramecium octaurelia TaxID=43137 RepID=A0A8S1VWP0_PAROT|nr:unnamed protein product [Paramecium octaurelia]
MDQIYKIFSQNRYTHVGLTLIIESYLRIYSFQLFVWTESEFLNHKF